MAIEAKASNIRFGRFVEAVEEIRDRLLRAAAALRVEGVPYAAIGGNAVAAWVTSVDRSAVRVTKDVDFLLRREDLPAAIDAMKVAGFFHYVLTGIHMFLDGADAGPRDAVHIVFAGEKVRPDDAEPAADMSQTTDEPDQRTYRVLTLDALVRMKLTSYRLKDKVHIQDLLDVDLVD